MCATLFGVCFLGCTAYRLWNDKGWPSVPYFTHFFVWLCATTGISVLLQQFEMANIWTLALAGVVGFGLMVKYGKKYRDWYRAEFPNFTQERHGSDEQRF